MASTPDPHLRRTTCGTMSRILIGAAGGRDGKGGPARSLSNGRAGPRAERRMKIGMTTAGAAIAAMFAGAGGAAAGDWVGRTFDRLDADGDGRITEAEAAAASDARFDRADADGDGRLTAAEATAEAQSRIAERFSRMDADGDGNVTLDEMRRTAGERMAGLAVKRFERLDGNGDGAVERAEFGATAGDRFRRLDADGDGSVTRDELQGSFRRGD